MLLNAHILIGEMNPSHSFTTLSAKSVVNHNLNNQTTVGLRLSNHWEPPTTTNTKIVSLYEETPRQFFNPTPTPKIATLGPLNFFI